LIRVGLVSGFFWMQSACGQAWAPMSSLASSPSLEDGLTCTNFERTQEKLWQSLQASVEERGRLPLLDEARMMIEQSLEAHASRPMKSDQQARALKAQVANRYAKLAETLQFEIVQSLAKDPTDREELKELLAALELGDRSTPERAHAVDQIQAHMQALGEDLNSLYALKSMQSVTRKSCDNLAETPPETAPPTSSPPTGETPESNLLEAWRKRHTPAVFGGLKTMAVTYQSCGAGARAPMGAADRDVDGISIVGTHPSGTGNKRVISNLNAFLSDHPYLHAWRAPASSGCFNVASAPPIYDYGGKPATSTRDETLLDLFTDAGTGTKELGIDCSAFVYTAYALAGLKFKRETSLRASLVHGVNSTMLTQPQSNGLSCLNHASFSPRESLKPGDIISIRGHVVMTEVVGEDPFGLAQIKSEAQCTLANMDVKRFNFNIMQSSPSKGGVGVNKMRARDYLTNDGTMGRGLRQHAVQACRAKFQNKTLASQNSDASVVRHLGTPECKAQPLRLTYETCIRSCPNSN